MNLKQAIELIAFKNPVSTPQLWLDLGSGKGLFTLALTNYLPAGSKIIAVDRDEKALKTISATANGVAIETRVADFIHDALDVKKLDGILMANSLHYVKDKEFFLNKLFPSLNANAVFLLVEYDRANANQWVPYPLTIDAAKLLFRDLGYSKFYVLNKRLSVYGDQFMYAAIIS